MATTYFDDGSSISYDDSGMVSSTPASSGSLLSDYSSNFNASNLNGAASSVSDLLKYGIGRVADYKTASMNAQNAQTLYANRNLVAVPTTLNTGTVLLLGGLALVAFFLTSGKG